MPSDICDHDLTTPSDICDHDLTSCNACIQSHRPASLCQECLIRICFQELVTMSDAAMPAGEANEQHYFVATQEKALRSALGKVSGGASIFVNVNGIHLEPPSERQRKTIQQVTPTPPCVKLCRGSRRQISRNSHRSKAGISYSQNDC